MKKVIKAILFDLDGTLLSMDQDVFVKAYFGGLSKRLAPLGYEPEKLIPAILQSTIAMVNNSGEKTNEEVFWNEFSNIFGEKVRVDMPHFERFYMEDFDKIKDVAVSGLPDARLGEIAAAIIEIKDGMTCTEEEINNFCKELPRYKRPRKIIFDNVPRTPTGKIEKPALRKKYGAEHLVEQQNLG